MYVAPGYATTVWSASHSFIRPHCSREGKTPLPDAAHSSTCLIMGLGRCQLVVILCAFSMEDFITLIFFIILPSNISLIRITSIFKKKFGSSLSLSHKDTSPKLSSYMEVQLTLFKLSVAKL